MSGPESRSGEQRTPEEAQPIWNRGDGPAVGESCHYCGALTLTWRKCKLICLSCAQINKSCADL